MKRTGVIIAALFLAFFPLDVSGQSEKAVKYSYSVQKIWDKGTHAAFTSLIEFKGRYWCSFREGFSHIFDDSMVAEGKVRILESRNGKSWKPVLNLGIPGIDCRDPKLSVTPDGRMMVLFDGSLYKGQELISQRCYVVFSEDGKTFTDPVPVQLHPSPSADRNWLWRVTWNGNAGYGVCYSSGGDQAHNVVSLYRTEDGVSYDLVKTFDFNGTGGETTLRFLPDGRMLMMVRRDSGDCMGLWGVSEPPYAAWDVKPMKCRLGGPDFIVLDEGKIIAGTRSYAIGNHCKTVLLEGNVKGDFQEVLVLPSDGDTSYPGLLVVGKELWVSYYSAAGKPGKAAIFLAKIPLAILQLN